MRIAIIQASSQAGKNELLESAVRRYAKGADIVNFGCKRDEKENYSYIEISVLIGLLLNSRAVDFVITGCSSGQGMMLACNSMPGVLCGYAPTPRDAYLFAQINNGNAVSLPLGEGYTWAGADNLDATLRALFSEPFGQGYPRAEAERKRRDAELLKSLRGRSQVDMRTLLEGMERGLVEKVLSKRDAADDILENGTAGGIADWIRAWRAERGKTGTWTVRRNELNTAQFLALWNSVWDGAPTMEQTDLALRHSVFRVSVFDGEKIIAMARMIGDRGLCYYIKDVVVRPEYQRRGVGRLLMGELLTFIQQHGTPGTDVAVELCAMPEKMAFYERFGFSANEAQRLRLFYHVE